MDTFYIKGNELLQLMLHWWGSVLDKEDKESWDYRVKNINFRPIPGKLYTLYLEIISAMTEI